MGVSSEQPGCFIQVLINIFIKTLYPSNLQYGSFPIFFLLLLLCCIFSPVEQGQASKGRVVRMCPSRPSRPYEVWSLPGKTCRVQTNEVSLDLYPSQRMQERAFLFWKSG